MTHALYQIHSAQAGHARDGSQNSDGGVHGSLSKAGSGLLALRVAVPADGTNSTAGVAQRLHAWASTAHAAYLPGHLTALSPSRDASNPHLQSRRSLFTDHEDTALPEQSNLTSASLNNGCCERVESVVGSLFKASPSWASRKSAHPQRAGTWHELRATSARHLPMTQGRDRGAARAANSARHGSECNLPAHLCEAGCAE